MSTTKDAMDWLAAQPDTLFVGQGVGVNGNKMSADFADIPADRRVEFPVAEELQLGLSLGLSLEGYCVVSVFPRWNFLLHAAGQLVNHLDRLPLYSDYRPRVIVRTAVGSKAPLDPGPQHDGDFTAAFCEMLKTVAVSDPSAGNEVESYRRAYGSGGSTLVVEGVK